MRASCLLGISLFAACGGVPAFSQVGAARTHIQGIDIPTVANAPFAAKVLVNWDEPLAGGGTVSKKYYTMVARDSQGRVHRETRGFVPAASNEEPPLRSVTILDPVSSTRTVCTEAKMSCAKGAFHPPLESPDRPGALAISNGSVTRENLGPRMMLGLSATGTRDTAMNQLGANGNSRLALTQTEV